MAGTYRIPAEDHSLGGWHLSHSGTYRIHLSHSRQFQQMNNEPLGTRASLLFLAASVMLAISIRTRIRWLRVLGLLMACCWIVFAVISYAPLSLSKHQLAVVVLHETVARSADSINAPQAFPEPLPSGTKVQVMEERSDWLRVRFFDGRDAWLPASSLQLLNFSSFLNFL